MKYSTINFKDVLTENPLFRIDAEFFKPEYFEADKCLRRHPVKCLGDISKSIINFGAYALCNQIEFLSKGVPFLNVGDISENWIDYAGAKRIDKKLSNKVLSKSLVKEGQILLTIAGTIGNASVAYKLPEFTNSNQAIANITLRDGISPFYVSTYLNSRFGKLQTTRLTISSVQPNLLLVQVKNIKVPVLEYDFQILIERLYKKFHDLLCSSFANYSQASQILLSELNLSNWKPKHRLWFVKNYSDTKSAGRIDAEYFQPMYEEVVKAITLTKDHSCLDNLVSIKKCVEPGSEAYQESGVLFLRVSNLSKFGFKDGNQQYISEDLYKTLKQYQPKQGEILLSKDATPGLAYHLKEKPERMVPSGGILRLKVKDEERLYPEYLTLVLNSIIVQKQIERDAGGSIINHWLVTL